MYRFDIIHVMCFIHLLDFRVSGLMVQVYEEPENGICTSTRKQRSNPRTPISHNPCKCLRVLEKAGVPCFCPSGRECVQAARRRARAWRAWRLFQPASERRRLRDRAERNSAAGGPVVDRALLAPRGRLRFSTNHFFAYFYRFFLHIFFCE